MHKVEMSAWALRRVMGEALDEEQYERGRHDARELFKKDPDARTRKLAEVKSHLENGEVCGVGPSYWVGCLCEFDFHW